MARPLLCELPTAQTPETLAGRLLTSAHPVLLWSARPDAGGARYSYVTAEPFLVFHSRGSSCVLESSAGTVEAYGNPWHVLDQWLARFELQDELDLPFPLGGCFGYWGYDLKNFIEPRLKRIALADLSLPDAWAGFYDSLVVFDHLLGKATIVSTGFRPDGSRCPARAQQRMDDWRRLLEEAPASGPCVDRRGGPPACIRSNTTREEYLTAVRHAQRWIRSGDIYQVNLAQRLEADCCAGSSWALFQELAAVSPAPYAAFIDIGGAQLISSSPELFLRMSGAQVRTRPIKGTRPRSTDPVRDAQLAYELQTSPKELAELVMITDLLRNDLGKICEFGTVHAPELVKLERYAHVQHLVSTVEGRLRSEMTHLAALASSFPGGSITGAPKIRAMEIIEQTERVTRGPYTGCAGYLGFNRESQLSILIRTAIRCSEGLFFSAGSGIVADSDPEAEYEETWAKAAGFVQAVERVQRLAAPVH